MSREDLLRDTMRRLAGGEPPGGDPFVRFRARQRRAARWRMLTAIGTGVAALVALFALLPGVGSEGEPGGAGTSGTPRPQPRYNVHYVDNVAKFEFIYPDGWEIEGRYGSYVAVFPSIPGEVKNQYTRSNIGKPQIETPLGFYMIVRVIDDAARDARLDDINAQERTGKVLVEESERMFGTRRADVRFLTYTTEGPPEGAVVEEWCSLCVMHEYLMEWPDDVVLDVRFVAPDEETFKAFKADMEYALETFAYYGLDKKT